MEQQAVTSRLRGNDEDKQRDVASKGGQSVPAEKRSFSPDPELASEAGKKGGESSRGGQQQASSSERGRKVAEGNERGGSGNFAGGREKAIEAGRKGWPKLISGGWARA